MGGDVFNSQLVCLLNDWIPEKELGVKLPKPGTPAKEKKLAMEKRNVAVQAKKTGVGKAKAVKVVLADKKIM